MRNHWWSCQRLLQAGPLRVFPCARAPVAGANIRCNLSDWIKYGTSEHHRVPWNVPTCLSSATMTFESAGQRDPRLHELFGYTHKGERRRRRRRLPRHAAARPHRLSQASRTRSRATFARSTQRQRRARRSAHVLDWRRMAPSARVWFPTGGTDSS